jgi:enoyl-CoA hydratase/carnithine racemase
VSEALANARASQTHDAQEAVKAFLEKRPAKFQGF